MLLSLTASNRNAYSHTIKAEELHQPVRNIRFRWFNCLCKMNICPSLQDTTMFVDILFGRHLALLGFGNSSRYRQVLSLWRSVLVNSYRKLHLTWIEDG